MAVAPDASSSTSSNSATSVTLSHTNNGDLLEVGVAVNNPSDVVTGATYAGVAMTRVRMDTTTYIYKLVAPATGANNIVVSLSSASPVAVFGQSFTGVDQTTPNDADSGSFNISKASPQSDNITVSAGGYAFDVMWGNTNNTMTRGGSQVLVGTEQSFGIGINACRADASYLSAATSMSWSWASGARAAGHSVVAIKSAAAAGGFFSRWYYDMIPGRGNV